MAVCALGYLGVHSDQLDDWRLFARKVLGLQEVDRGGKTVAFRMDDHKQRLVVSDESGETLAFLGWEVELQSDLELYASRLEDAGYRVTLGQKDLATQRCVSELIYFHDPDGNRVELFWRPDLATEPFVPGRPISGFVTGPVGMGHAVLHSRNTESLLIFYRDILDFRVSDFGLAPVPLYFFHVNDRHHSFALIGTGGTGFHHFMIEYQNLDDVGQGYDIALQSPDQIAYTLGRHTNDYMTSYYSHTPSEFFVESGWGGRLINTATWEPHETKGGPSFWGHDRLYLPEDLRAEYREMRMDLASDGIQAPAVVDCPWLYQNYWKD